MTAVTERPEVLDAPRVQRPIDRTPRPPRSTSRIGGWLRRNGRNLVYLLPVMAIAAVVQAVNMGGSPQRIDDEGTYVAQAWAVLFNGELAHYTYWYDHPPVGWLQIAAYAGLTNAFGRYDISVLAGREFMVVATVVGVALLWLIGRRLGLSRVAATVASAIFALSPLAVQFHRSVYLDNVATPWLLASILLAMSRKSQLAGFAGSAIALGIAVLSKETYLLALPLVAYLMWKNARPATRRYTLSVAASLLGLIGISYLVFALVKGELTPGADRVSLVEGVMFQLGSRDGSGSLLDPESLFAATTGTWFQLDPVLIIVGTLAAVAGLFVRRLRPIAIALVLLIAFMFRPGGYLPVPYVIMLLPLAALLIAGVTDRAVRTYRRRSGARKTSNVVWIVAMVAALAVTVPTWGTQLRGLLLADLDAPSRQAQSWIEQNVPQDSRLLVDDIMWVDLVDAGFTQDNVIWFYKLDTDSAVQAQSPNGWRDSDYIVTTDSMLSSPDAASVQEAVASSTVVATFGEGDQQVEVRDISPEGVEAAATAAEASAQLRLNAGTQLAQNPGLEAADRDLSRLEAGQIDERALLALGQLTITGGVTVADFPIVMGEEDLLFRQVLLTSIDGESAVDGDRVSAAGRQAVDQLTGRYAPERVTATADGLLLTWPVGPATGVVN